MEHQPGDRFTARATKNPGRKSFLVEFRHPLKNDNNNKPGRKIRKGLGTDVEDEANRLAEQLNALLGDARLWSLGARPQAEQLYDSKVVEIFYSEIEPRSGSARILRDSLLPFPASTEGFAQVLLLGVPGAGKTTLLRQLIGTNPDTERFPSTSVNRTTTFPTELIVKDGRYQAVVSFMSEHEARFEIEECVSAAIVEAVDGSARQVARALLEKSDMRFRLKYILGNLDDGQEASDPYDDNFDDLLGAEDSSLVVTVAERSSFKATIQGYLDRILTLARTLKASMEAGQGPLDAMTTDDRNAALDLIEEQASESDEFVAVVSEILDELRAKFDGVVAGQFEKTTTGWPRAWCLAGDPEGRADFLRAVRYFSGISHQSWGKLLTPLVNGMRVSGPFRPVWADTHARLVLVDTEGLGHKANATADLPEELLGLIHEAQVVLLVDSAKNGMTNFAAGKALEGVVNAGQTRKLAVVFTHMDAVKGENLRGQSKYDHVFAGLRNVIENQVARNVSVEAARYLSQHLEHSTFYLGRIDEFDAKPAKPELNKLLSRLTAAQPPVFEPVAFPEYSSDNLVLAIQEAAREFRQQWQGMLGVAPHVDHPPKPWQTIKALSRRYAEGLNDGFVLRPTSNLVTALSSAISRFLETPIGWTGSPTPEQQRATIEAIKEAVSKQLPAFARRRLREEAQPSWQEAYSLRGAGSTFVRRTRIEGIYEHWVPIPDARGDRLVFEFLGEVKDVVMVAINQIERQFKTKAAGTAGGGSN